MMSPLRHLDQRSLDLLPVVGNGPADHVEDSSAKEQTASAR
jgi:hypothetical protein